MRSVFVCCTISSMDTNKIVRSICYFSDNPSAQTFEKLDGVEKTLVQNNFLVQTKRLCSAKKDITELDSSIKENSMYGSVGTLAIDEAEAKLPDFFSAKNTSFNIDLTNKTIDDRCVDIVFSIIKNKPDKTFLFTYVFNNAPSTPFFPSATYEKNGFSLGLQSTDLSVGCTSIEEWLDRTKNVWLEITRLFETDTDFLGIDSSVAPLNDENGSFVGFIKRLGFDFPSSVTTTIYLEITKHIKENNPKPVGLCGMMLPCLEDRELAKEYEKGNFSIERNIFLSLHSGLGIDTYPIGIDEDSKKVKGILTLVQGLSNKYKKPLSVRFVSDGKTKIGEKTDFQNPYLQDVVIRPL